MTNSPGESQAEFADVVEPLDVIVRRALGWPDGSSTLSSLASELRRDQATVHLCAADDGPAPSTGLDMHLHRCPSNKSTGMVLNRALSAGTASKVLILDSTDVLMRHAVVRMLGAFRDAKYDVCFGMVIDWTGNLTSALPVEAARLEQRNYIAAASLWNRSALEALGGWSEVPHSEEELTWDLWKRLSRTDRNSYFMPRPVVRQQFVQRAIAPA